MIAINTKPLWYYAELELKTALVAFIVLFCNFNFTANAQDAEPVTSEEEAVSVNTIPDIRLEDPLWSSSRANAMGGALSAFASDLDAPYYNPAGIGGIPWKDYKGPFVRNVYFPGVTGAMNKNARTLNKDFSDQKATKDSTLGKALVDAAEGKQQYGRVSTLLGMTLGRTMVVPYLDQQGAAISHGGDSGLIDGHFRSNSGIGIGTSIADSQGRLFLGVFSHYTSSTVYQGTYDYLEMIDAEKRKQPLKETTYKYSAKGTNVGMLWRVPKTVHPSVGLVVRDYQNTTYHLLKKPDGVEAESYKTREDVTLSAAISPRISGWGEFNMIVEESHLSSREHTGKEKWRVGMEFNLWDYGADAPLSLRAGANYTGMSYGMGINLTMFRLEFSSYTVNTGDIGTPNIERRTSGLFVIDIADR